MTETLIDDTLRGLTLGDPDGPLKFIETLGREVPTYIDPREDLIVAHARGKFKYLMYHVPFQMRGDFKAAYWPHPYQLKVGKPRVDTEGYVLCCGVNRSGGLCGAKAMNRSHFCRNHGGALHPADKKISKDTIMDIPQDRITALDRPQQFMQGFLKLDDLDDDEVQGGFIRNNLGQPVKARILGIKFEQQLAKELHGRLNRFLQSKASSMLHVMVDIAENDLYEAADRLKAAQWVAERTIGKTPDVVLTGTTEAPYASILESIESGSREDYRKSVRSERVDPPIDQTDKILDVSEVDEDGDSGSYRTVLGGSRDSYREGTALQDRRDSDNEGERIPSTEIDLPENTGDSESLKERTERIETDRVQRIAKLKAIRRGKQRRFAARAIGATSLSEHPWLIELKPIRGKTTYRLVLYGPDDQTPALVERVLTERSWVEATSEEIMARRVAASNEEIASLEGKLSRLKGA